MYEIIWYRLDHMVRVEVYRYWYNRSNNQLFIYFQAIGTRISGLVVPAVSLVGGFNNNPAPIRHHVFYRYLVGVSSQNLMSCHQLVAGCQ